MMLLRCLSVSIVGMLTLLLATPAVAQPVKLASESYHVPARDPGIQLYVRNKRPEAMTSFTSDRILLFVHGATYPAETTFDLQLDGLSWMDYIAQRGYDVYLMDVRGYGRSTRPPEMARPATENRPIVHTDVAVKDFGTVVDHILARRGVTKINLIAWSWGTVIAGAFTAQNNEKVERLVLYAPVWLRQPPSLVAGPLGAYRTVTMEAARQRWLTGVAADKQKDLIPSGWFEAWWILSAPGKARPSCAPRTESARTANGTGGQTLGTTTLRKFGCRCFWRTRSGTPTRQLTCHRPSSRD
jgi:pimeloyl-ACP methyl ester carboxylesterase